jgi:hypothetical protein
MSPLESAAIIRDQMKEDEDLARSIGVMVQRSGHADIYEWCEANPEHAVALGEQLVDIGGQISNMESRLARGDLS